MLRISAFLYPLVFAAGCATQPEITFDYDQDQDFSTYETFVWMAGAPLTVEGELDIPESVLAKIESAVRDEMRKKGFVEVYDRSEADFTVSVVAGLSETVSVEAIDQVVYLPSEISVYDRAVRAGSVVSASGFDEVSIGPIVNTIDEGKLAIAIYDVESGQLVWSAVAYKDVTYSARDGAPAVRGVRRFLENFPPDAK